MATAPSIPLPAELPVLPLRRSVLFPLTLQPIVWYVSGHGFGHASRDIEIINALRECRPGLPVIVRTGARRWLFDLTLKAPVEFQPVDCDTGVVQIDGLRLDEEVHHIHAEKIGSFRVRRGPVSKRPVAALARPLLGKDPVHLLLHEL